MNRLESRYADELEAHKRLGTVAGYWFEGITLKLAHDTRYTPDFLVQLPDGALELHEVKGFMRDDANVKLKVAAALFPFAVVLVQYVKGIGFTTKEIVA